MSKRVAHCCRVCQQMCLIPLCRARTHNWICNTCNYRKSDKNPSQYLARKLANTLRYHGVCGPYPGTAFVRKLLDERNNNIPLDELRKWCIVRIDPKGPWQVDNACLIPSVYSRSLCCIQDPTLRKEILNKEINV